MNITLPLIIFAVSANIANFTMALSAIATIRLNRKFLPKEFRPKVWREFILILNFIFFGFFFSVFFTVKGFESQILKIERSKRCGHEKACPIRAGFFHCARTRFIPALSARDARHYTPN